MVIFKVAQVSELFQSLNDIIRIKAARVIDIDVSETNGPIAIYEVLLA